MGDEGFSLTLDLREGYAFGVAFPATPLAPLEVDESPPLGEGRGPNPARLLAAAVGHCLSASALFCLRKARIDVRDMRTTLQVALARNERGRLRIGGIQVRIEPRVAPEDRERTGRCLEIFEDFCVVTQSVRSGLDVKVQVAPVAAS